MSRCESISLNRSIIDAARSADRRRHRRSPNRVSTKMENKCQFQWRAAAPTERDWQKRESKPNLSAPRSWAADAPCIRRNATEKSNEKSLRAFSKLKSLFIHMRRRPIVRVCSARCDLRIRCIPMKSRSCAVGIGIDDFIPILKTYRT